MGRELLSLKMQAASYTDEVKRATTISPGEIEAVKEKISSNFYFDPEVIDKVVDKLTDSFHKINNINDLPFQY